MIVGECISTWHFDCQHIKVFLPLFQHSADFTVKKNMLNSCPKLNLLPEHRQPGSFVGPIPPKIRRHCLLPSSIAATQMLSIAFHSCTLAFVLPMSMKLWQSLTKSSPSMLTDSEICGPQNTDRQQAANEYFFKIS